MGARALVLVSFVTAGIIYYVHTSQTEQRQLSTVNSVVTIKNGRVDIQAVDESNELVTDGGETFVVYVTRMNYAIEDAVPETISYTLYWRDLDATEVMVAGAFNEWKREPMSKVDGQWTYSVYGLRPNALYRFKYFVDGQWRVDHEQPVDNTEMIEGQPIENNAIGLGNPPIEEIAEERETQTLRVTEHSIIDDQDGKYHGEFDPSGAITVSVRLSRPFHLRHGEPFASTSQVDIKNDEIRIQSIDAFGKSVDRGGHTFTAQIFQESSTVDILLTGYYSGPYQLPDPTRPATLVIKFNGQYVTYASIAPSRSKPKGTIHSSYFHASASHILVNLVYSNDLPACDESVYAKVLQEGGADWINLSHQGGGAYSAHWNGDEERDAMVELWLNESILSTQKVDATRPRAAVERTEVNVTRHSVTVTARTSRGSPALYCGNHLSVEKRQDRATERVNLHHHGNGIYRGDYTLHPLYDAVIEVKLYGDVILSERLKAVQPPASRQRTTFVASAGHVRISARTADDQPALHSEEVLEARVTQKNRGTMNVQIRHVGSGSYEGEWMHDEEEGCEVEIMMEGVSLGVRRVEALRPKQPLGLSKLSGIGDRTPLIEGNDWIVSFCGCDLGVCLTTLYCLPCQLAYQNGNLEERDCDFCDCLLAMCCPCICGCVVRGRIRQKYGIKGGAASDCLSQLCCPLCATAQQTRELHVRGGRPSGLFMSES
ncbi:hypothetical protein PROFUN_01155 [Planoprotostelium fungivorum]|uniref:AMP-activated protein kinase glycogen-binding domain-containing protein n=1 Tax=Planoprotostelium fungivorum TaxID=1890364 RepID=A0A2P6NCI3_9EUKA|nr:hypothetical protein PROFUN_01155 [Planoprotostelium fungivorum]